MKSQLATAFGIFLWMLCLASCVTQPAIISYAATTESPKIVQTYVVSHGWHTALIVPASSLNRQIPSLKSRFEKPAYYEIGWGDAAFYQAKSITPGIAMRAAFWSQGTALHISTVPISPYQSFPCSRICPVPLSQSQADNMGEFISTSMAHDPYGKVIPLREGIYGDSHFYQGSGRYSVINTCNNWTAKGLRSAGLNISPWSKFSSKSVMRALKKSSTLVTTSPHATLP